MGLNTKTSMICLEKLKYCVHLKVYIFQSKSYKEIERLDKLLIIVNCGHVRYYDESICIRIRHEEAGGSLLTLSMSNCQLCTCTT